MNSRGPSEKVDISSYKYMPGDLKVVHIRQVFRSICVRINAVPLLQYYV